MWAWFKMIGWSIVQDFLSIAFEGFIDVWGTFATEMLIGIILYEVMVLGISFDDIVK